MAGLMTTPFTPEAIEQVREAMDSIYTVLYRLAHEGQIPPPFRAAAEDFRAAYGHLESLKAWATHADDPAYVAHWWKQAPTPGG